MPGAQVGGLLDAGSGVIEEQHQGAVAQGQAPAGGQAGDQVLDLVLFQEPGLGRGGPFYRDGGHLLAGAEQLGVAAGQVLEQAVHRGQPLVAGAHVVAPVLLKVAQEAEDTVEGEVPEPETGDLAALVRSGEHQQQPDGVPVAAPRQDAGR